MFATLKISEPGSTWSVQVEEPSTSVRVRDHGAQIDLMVQEDITYIGVQVSLKPSEARNLAYKILLATDQL